jgi:hypothetical protein
LDMQDLNDHSSLAVKIFLVSLEEDYCLPRISRGIQARIINTDLYSSDSNMNMHQKVLTKWI